MINIHLQAHLLDFINRKEHSVYDHNPLSRAARALIATLTLCCALLSVSYADIPPNRPKSSTADLNLELKVTDPSQPAASAFTPAVGSAPQVKVYEPSPAELAKEQAELAKEQRLEELRYKHLWIAYSIVWLVIFMFIRSTWKRSEAVAARLDELKGRVKRLEAQRSSEEG